MPTGKYLSQRTLRRRGKSIHRPKGAAVEHHVKNAVGRTPSGHGLGVTPKRMKRGMRRGKRRMKRY